MNIAAIKEAPDHPIYLVGFMGSGKTHWGKLLAAHLQREFIDLDQLIESKEQLSIQQIFEKKGEDWFREKEASTLRSLPPQPNLLISCGGGAPCFHDNMNYMNQTGTTVFLEASPKFLLQNIISEPQVRPLLRHMNEAEMLFFIEKKLQERIAFYKQARLSWNVEELTAADIQKL